MSRGIFLVAQYFMKPRDHVNTSKKGWMDNPDNIRWDEKVGVTRGLKTRDHSSQVILDLGEKKIVRNTFQSGKNFDEIFRYFLTGYSQYLAPVMIQLDPDYMKAIVEEIQGELDALPKDGEVPVAEAVEVVDEEVKAE